jgi:hypothetical protein
MNPCEDRLPPTPGLTGTATNMAANSVPTEIVVPAVVCVTVVLLVAICTVILALYWKFKIKVIRET